MIELKDYLALFTCMWLWYFLFKSGSYSGNTTIPYSVAIINKDKVSMIGI